MVKNLPVNAGDLRGLGLIPGSERDSLEEGMATHSSILAWRIPWTEEPGGLQPMGTESDRTEETLPASTVASLGAQMQRIHLQCGDLGSIPGLGRSAGEVKGYPLQYSCLENSMDRGAW